MGTRKIWSHLTGAGATSKKQNNQSRVKSKQGDNSKSSTRTRLSPIKPTTNQIAQVTPAKAPTSPSAMMAQLQLSRSAKKTRRPKLLSSKSFRPLVNLNLQLSAAVRNKVMKARQERQTFVRLTNELSTPPAKLYSPFNIVDTPENRLESTRAGAETRGARRKLENSLSITSMSTSATDRSESTKLSSDSSGFIDCSLSSVSPASTPKERVALQHKRHLMHANKFAFDSPTGRLRETVKEVEHFQECIEAISKAIESRQSN